MPTKNLTVSLSERAYLIHFEDSFKALRSCVAELRAAGRGVYALTDAHVLDAQPQYLEDAGFEASEILAFPSGEKTKSAEFFSQALSFLATQAANRDCAVFAFGGGVTGDLAGFVAASYLRGVDFYQIPSTLLSMVDSSVGGKTGINLPEGKNLVGAFWQPKAVFIDTSILKTLPSREFAAGMAEVIKYGLLADLELLEKLEALDSLCASSGELPAIVRRCCEIKAEVVVADEKETAGSGGRALLNFGHTFGHAIENVAGYGSYLHGEAVAIGMVLATQLSVALGQIPEESIARVIELVEKYHLPATLTTDLDLDELMSAMLRDKKNRGGKLRFVTIEALGVAVTTDDVDSALVRELWKKAKASVGSVGSNDH